MYRNWKKYRPNNLRDAMRACVAHARDKKNLSVEQIADLMGINSWTLYKYLETGKMPANMLLGFQTVCGVFLVSQHLAVASGFLPVDMPRAGKAIDGDDTMAVQEACNEAVREIMRFARDREHAQQMIDAILPALEHLVWHKNHGERELKQPDLEFTDEL